ncbi:hypothetical protein SS50377_24790 [Spironucleus salmonicida]|uniref:Uncharacterized protein n=1 Tax=Spironucleus salmonicida TaxID=348837 RepID=V6LJH7_9EUKA|nr:hypothetical protein SS50377_24790 [Spironucleus salmonicida]|eukprot:EST44672.1 Hypothetical protein SS50377_15449 [Spironucleus salmonicida]
MFKGCFKPKTNTQQVDPNLDPTTLEFDENFAKNTAKIDNFDAKISEFKTAESADFESLKMQFESAQIELQTARETIRSQQLDLAQAAENAAEAPVQIDQLVYNNDILAEQNQQEMERLRSDNARLQEAVAELQAVHEVQVNQNEQESHNEQLLQEGTQNDLEYTKANLQLSEHAYVASNIDSDIQKTLQYNNKSAVKILQLEQHLQDLEHNMTCQAALLDSDDE